MERLYDPKTWDITVVDSASTVSNANPALNAVGDYYKCDTWAEFDMTLFNIPIIRLKQELGYNYYVLVKIDRIYHYDAYVKHNYAPVVQVELKYSNNWISGSDAYGEFRMSYKVGPWKGMSVQVGNVHGKLWGNYIGACASSWWLDLL